MFNLKSLLAASAAATLLSGTSASVVVQRNEEPAQPSCVSFTPFVYAGCFEDPSSPERALLYNSNLPTDAMTVEKCVAFCKGNLYEYAGLEYYGQCFCGSSVNGPQLPESSCTFPCTGNSSQTCGGNDIISVYQDPTFPIVDDTTISDFQSIGCYSEGSNGRSLAWRQDQVSSTSLTIESCLSACKKGGYSFAGVEFAQECYCGVVLGNGTLPVDSSQCNMPCTGDDSETCGGRGTLNLYVAKDMESTEPCNGTPPVSSSSSSVITSTTTSSSSSSTSSSSVPPTTTTSSSSSVSTSSTKPPTTSPTSTSCKTTTTKPPTTSPTSTKTTASLCTSTYTVSPTPTCEYKCGKWCSSPLPIFGDKDSCFKAVSACAVQAASCFLHAGFPDSMNCFEFSNWCTSISSYCGSFCPGNKCSLPNCKSKYPPKNPPSGPYVPPPVVSTSVYTCPVPTSTAKPSTTSQKPSTTKCVPVPTKTNICKQPHNPGKGYTSTSPIGGLEIPILSCNNVYSDYKAGNYFKLYTYADTYKCPSYPNSGPKGPSKGCHDACDSQYAICVSTYAEGCRSKKGKRGFPDTYSSANNKCLNQRNDCYDANNGVSTVGRCGSWNSGWSR